ncbi:PEP-CTERM sorting domain-containing protein [Limnofasciculus baicalensis]|uniref:PEP-CTERM sorting domain-containing protein n=1 Tax=Limnofasciculus baicalensis BBK-W-15 TaxID=2699891 RepID=A0AAE3GNQ2_9CYAN|nr:PEP-CTERM sorting domain-containing protein [Limnofasciculus baicalensis]MCP2727191.1 PEP-CTERM sorting domain-containing protein [Limnofasciculus baicalensis BBK-W-15]
MALKSTFAILGLVAGSTLALSAIPAQAANLFGNSGIKFDETTTVDFWFVQSKGAFKSTLSVVEKAAPTTSLGVLFKENVASLGSANDFLGTCPETVTSPTGECHNWFTFTGGVEYSLLLDSGNNGNVWSTDTLNTPVKPQALFSFVATPEPGKYTIRFDDKGAGDDADFNDFTIMAQIKPVPEPTALAGLGVVAGALAFSRRRKSDRKS